MECTQEWNLYGMNYLLSETVMTTVMQKALLSEIPENFLNLVLLILKLNCHWSDFEMSCSKVGRGLANI